MDSTKKEIITIFHEKVKGKKPDITGANVNHDGAKGHWLERQFGIVANGDNEPDFNGYELKNETSSKTSFGDWTANEYIFNNPEYKNIFTGSTSMERRDKFMHIFGHANNKKHPGRFSWSGTPCPKLNEYSTFGQTYKFDDNKDIVIIYSYSHDMRELKASIVPNELQEDNIELARWYGEKREGIKGKTLCEKLNDKFNQKGWFTCKKDADGCYYKICFGAPMNYDNWLDLVKKGIVFWDSGMHEQNPRPYSMWRANNAVWDSLIIEEYE